MNHGSRHTDAPDTAPDATPSADDAPISKTRRKQQMHALQALGERLVKLPAQQLARVPMPEDLAQAVRRVAAGDAAFSPRLAGFVLDAFGAGTGEVAVADTELDRLSVREREVMRLIARGYTYKECASELFISVKTVETHVSAVLRKLQLSNRNELTRWAVARRIV